MTTLTKTDLDAIAAVRRLLDSGLAAKLRGDARLGVAELAAAVGVSPVTVWRWERRLRVPRPAAALRLARVYDILLNDGAEP